MQPRFFVIELESDCNDYIDVSRAADAQSMFFCSQVSDKTVHDCIKGRTLIIDLNQRLTHFASRESRIPTYGLSPTD
jgi:hypothetical protein